MFNFLEVSLDGGCVCGRRGGSLLFSTFLLAEIWMYILEGRAAIWTTNLGLHSNKLEGGWVPDDPGTTLPALSCLHLHYREINFYLV